MAKSLREIILNNPSLYYRCYGGIEAREADNHKALTDDEVIEEINYTIRVNEQWLDLLPSDDEEHTIFKKENTALKKLLKLHL